MFSEEKYEKIIIVDFGSQVTKLIARRIRDFGVYSEIITAEQAKEIKDFKDIKGIILSGGPSTVTKKNYQTISKSIFSRNIPILGICYGLQLIAKLFGGKIKSSNRRREFGRANIFQKKKSKLTKNFLNSKTAVWMSHEDAVVSLPRNFKLIASTKNSKFTIIENEKKKTIRSSISPGSNTYR